MAALQSEVGSQLEQTKEDEMDGKLYYWAGEVETHGERLSMIAVTLAMLF